MKGFVLFLVVVLLACAYAAPQATNYGDVSANSGSSASGAVSGSNFGHEAFRPAARDERWCGLLWLYPC